MKLSVLIPVYNEKDSLSGIVGKVLDQQVPSVRSTEVIIVDDGSTDGTGRVLTALADAHPGHVFPLRHERNQGKGAAIRTALARVTGDICLIQDADLEYDPSDYPLLLEPLINGRADVVYGSRFVGSQAKRVLFFWHYLGNQFLTLLSNMCTNLNLTDMETCYKAFRTDLLKSIPVRSERFGFEPEITAKVARRGCRIYEVGISYRGRTYEEGKKITWVDGLKAILTILKYAVVRDAGPLEETVPAKDVSVGSA